MEEIQAFYEATNQLLELLQEEKMNRDIRIEKIQHLLDQREDLLKKFQPPFSQQEQEIGDHLVELNQKVEQLLQKQKLEIQQDLKKLHIQRETNHKYTNPYESLSIDGVFYDKRN